MQRLVIIGFGAIGRLLFERLEPGKFGAQVAAVVTRSEALAITKTHLPPSVLVCSSVRAAMVVQPTLFIECAGHAGLRIHGCDVLRMGLDLLVGSVGALADPALEKALREAAVLSGATVLIPAGALGGLDALSASRYAGLEDVEYSSTKNVQSWTETHAEALVDLSAVSRRVTFFTGNAREAATLFPRNANVAAAVALAGIGFERTHVTLSADPEIQGNRHEIRAHGEFGSIEVSIQSRVLPENPQTSLLAPMSLLRAIDSRSSAIRVI
jgi:aspartate dehydrogenase